MCLTKRQKNCGREKNGFMLSQTQCHVCTTCKTQTFPLCRSSLSFVKLMELFTLLPPQKHYLYVGGC